MAKKKASKKTGGRGRGGRKPGTWELVSPEQIRAYREAHAVSRASLAGQLGVSGTTIQNWETGHAVATKKAQERLAQVLGGAPRSSAPAASTPAARPSPSSGYDSAVEATGRIVAAFLGSVKLKRGELGGVIREVREALR